MQINNESIKVSSQIEIILNNLEKNFKGAQAYVYDFAKFLAEQGVGDIETPQGFEIKAEASIESFIKQINLNGKESLNTRIKSVGMQDYIMVENLRSVIPKLRVAVFGEKGEAGESILDIRNKFSSVLNDKEPEESTGKYEQLELDFSI